MSSSKWVAGTKNGQPYYLNLETDEQTFIKPKDFGKPERTISQQECTDKALEGAQLQLRNSEITQEEYDLIVETIQAAQDVDDADQFLHQGQLDKFGNRALPEDVASDPALMVTDLSTGQKLHLATLDDQLPVGKYDSFDTLYVVDKDSGRRSFLSDVQIEQYDTFKPTKNAVGILRRKAKCYRDKAPTELRVKMYNALKELDTRLQTPSGQRVLVRCRFAMSKCVALSRQPIQTDTLSRTKGSTVRGGRKLLKH